MTIKFNKWDLLLKAERPVQVPHSADFLSPEMYKKIQDAIHNMIGYNYSCILEAEGEDSESAEEFDAGWVQEDLEGEFLDACNAAIWEECKKFIEKGEKEL